MRNTFLLETIVLAGAVACAAPKEPTGPSVIAATAGTPAATYTVSGIVAETGGGRPLEGVTVSGAGGVSAVTDQNGFYRLADLLAWQADFLRFSKPGFEDGGRRYGNGGRIDIRLQRSLVITAGDTLAAILYTDDPYFSDLLSDENACEPCKQIRVNVPNGGTLDVRLTLPAQSTEFGLLIETSHMSAGVGCCKPEISGAYPVGPGQLYLRVYRREGSSAGDQPFEITTSLR
jgi:hypothetical protein